jgi:hypothetical protein
MESVRDVRNASVEGVLDWAEEMAKKGLYEPNTGRHLRSAVKAMASILDAGERTPQFLIENLEAVADRWARANKANPSTMRTYRQRAGALLEDFAKYMESPTSFKGRGGSTPRKSEKAERQSAAKAEAVVVSHTSATALNMFRLPNSKTFFYSLPDDFTIEDLRRVVYHLLPATSDFDPMVQNGGFPPMSAAPVVSAAARS